ncbi:MAG: glycosyltransferase family 2 protein [Candidatus Jordarchaeum sp.]|uniref:glycosyltransferase family 2 protein n=1 Tax=Candidatus Jordarchaeum sp. TaxID=2823881 RepID=UPI004049E145
MKVSIITRAFDRLEYTIKCINGVRYNTGYDDYEHIIINQGSRDGTKEWLNWIKKMPNDWYEKVKPVHLKRNVGDFGGMKVGFKYADGDLIMQLDNDIFMETKDWLLKMVFILKTLDVDVLMANRRGFKERIPHDEKTLKMISYNNNEELSCVRIPKAVSCYIIKRDLFEEGYKKALNCRQLTKNLECWKLLDVFGEHIEGYDPVTGSYLQHDKYGFQANKIFLSKRFFFKHGKRKVP